MGWLGILLAVLVVSGLAAGLLLIMWKKLASNWFVWPVAVALPFAIGSIALMAGISYAEASVTVSPGSASGDAGPLVFVAVLAFGSTVALAAFFGALAGVYWSLRNHKRR